jgi:rRNA-processing protein FCF1
MEMDIDESNAVASYIEYCRNIDPQNEPDSIDIDIDQSSEFEVIGGNISYLVVDTNFILSHLDIITELEGMATEFGLKIIIPITVIRELDGLKSSSKTFNESSGSTRTVSLGFLARKAIEWIYSSLAENSTVVKGQKLTEKNDSSLVQDDSILDCCLYFQNHKANVLVILLSDDKNLCLKALTNDIKTVSFRKGITGQLIAKVIHDENVHIFGVVDKVEKVVTKPVQHKKPEHLKPSTEWIKATENTNGITDIDNASSTVFREIQAITISAINHSMEKVYGEDLDLVRDYDHPSVKSLQRCSEVLIRFWFPVFQEFFQKLPQRFVPFEETNPGQRTSPKHPLFTETPTNLEELAAFVEFWSTTLTAIYSSVMDKTQNEALIHLINRWNKLSGMS